MQTIKEKLNDMSTMRKAKAEAKEDEKAEKEFAKTRVQVAHEVRMAREAEAAMDLHVNKAAEKVAEHERKHQQPSHGSGGRQDFFGEDSYTQDGYGRNPNSPTAGYSTDPIYGGGTENSGGALDPYATYGRDSSGIDSTASTAGTGYTASRSGGPPTNNNLL
ncbi:hypothetical protein Pfo_005663 [Paulownia fortunei]|nr:hypothetical protein Pfo_005663 [Paulownia fortunei]